MRVLALLLCACAASTLNWSEPAPAAPLQAAATAEQGRVALAQRRNAGAEAVQPEAQDPQTPQIEVSDEVFDGEVDAAADHVLPADARSEAGEPAASAENRDESAVEADDFESAGTVR